MKDTIHTEKAATFERVPWRRLKQFAAERASYAVREAQGAARNVVKPTRVEQLIGRENA